jgi:hypothetical protein
MTYNAPLISDQPVRCMQCKEASAMGLGEASHQQPSKVKGECKKAKKVIRNKQPSMNLTIRTW